jgi:acetamidase/formamidase
LAACQTSAAMKMFTQIRRNPNMNKDMFESKWKQIRSQSNGWWSLVTEEELDKVAKAAVKFDKYVTMLQVKYGYTRDQARKELSKHVTEYEARQKLNP